MKVYRVYSANQFNGLMHTHIDLDEIEMIVDGRYLNDIFPKNGFFITKDHGYKTGNFFSVSTLHGILACDIKARNFLIDAIDFNVEFIEINTESTVYFVVNILDIFDDALDVDNSIVFKFVSGSIMIDKESFYADRIKNLSLFKIDKTKSIYATDNFLSKYYACHLTGLSFWDIEACKFV